MTTKLTALILSVVLAASLSACSGQSAEEAVAESSHSSSEAQASVPEENDAVAGTAYVSSSSSSPAVSEPAGAPASSAESESASQPADLEVRFGDDGEPFVLHLDDNSTAAAIADYVGTADWRLPIYHYDDYENWEVMQYYDIPSRYEIPSNAQTITSAQAGEVYYSDPNRIVLFYRDAEVPGEYTRVGYFDDSDTFQAAVENNPVLEGWGNKIVIISDGE